MPSFTLNGIVLELPDGVLTPPLREALRSGRYENAEAAALARHLRPGDRVLELGAGAGYLAALAARVLGAAAVLGVEGHPEMAEVARANLNANGFDEAALLWGAAVEDAHDGAPVRFHIRPAFWASARAAEGRDIPASRLVEVPALRLGDLIARHRPTVLIVDVEGGEIGLFDQPLSDGIRLVILEIHPGRYGPQGTKHVFDRLSASGMAYCPAGSRGDTLVFERVPAEG